MNVIVSNRQKEIIDNANIDAIKDLNGLFSVDDLINKFKNYFFSKMILDATSVVDFATREVLQKLSNEIGADRLIILLPTTPEPPEEFKRLLIELKIYNFSNNIDDVVKFIDNPNTYENALNTIANSYSNSNDYYVDSSIKDGEDNVEDEDTNYVDSTNNSDVSNQSIDDNYNKENQHSSLGDIMSRFNVYNNDGSIDTNDNKQEEKEEIEEENKSDDSSNQNENVSNMNGFSNNSYTFLNMVDYDTNKDYNEPKTKYILGFKNITKHAGSTTLIYMLEKEAEKKNKDIISIEINKNDFKFFRNKKMISVKEEDLSNTLSSLREEVVLVDLNDYQDENICNEVVYLIEPSTIKLNELMMLDRNIFNTLKDKKVVLNQSMLSNEDIPVLEREANMKFFFNVGSINDRIDNLVIEELFNKLVND